MPAISAYAMNIFPKLGVDEIRLGMNRKLVQSILGAPCGIIKNQREEEWEYDCGIVLCFQKCDLFLLSTITVLSQQARLNGKTIIDLSELCLVSEFPEFSLDENFEEGGKCYMANSSELMAWVSDGVVSSITLFPEYDETGLVPIWPSVLK